MRVKNLKFLAFLLIVSGLLPQVFGASPKVASKSVVPRAVWAHEQSDLKPDSTVVWGRLDNGVRYVIKPNDEPPGQVSMRLYVDAGSLMEDDDQRGLAHFLEHVSFKGGKYFADEKSLVQYFERIGMAFGADTNAHTSLDETVYKLELPKNTEEYLRDGLKVLSDFGGGLLLKQEAIDSERGVILSEKRDHYTVDERVRDAFFEFALPGTLIPYRMPIGIESVIENANRDQFLKFYKDWYNTSREVVVIVGSVDPKAVVPLIEEYFGWMKPPVMLNEDPDLGDLVLSKEVKAKVHVEKEATAADLEFFVVRQHERYLDKQAQRVKNIQRNVGYQILSKRLSLISKQETAPFTYSLAQSVDLFNTFEIALINVKPKEGKWAECIPIIEQELRRVLQYGFTESEMAEAKANVINKYEQAVQSAPKRQSKVLVNAIVDAVSEKRVFTSPEEELRIAKLALGGLTEAQCLELFRQDWEGYSPLIFLTGNNSLNASEARILELYQESHGKAVEAPKSEPVPEFAYQYFGEPGKIVEEGYYEKLDIYYYRFANNVRLNLKKTDFNADMIFISVLIGNGELEEPKDKIGLGALASAVFYQGGLEKHSSVDLERIFSGKTMDVSFNVGSNAFQLGGVSNRRDFAQEMNLLTAFVVAPGYRDEAFRHAKVDFEELYRGLELKPDSVLANRVDRFLAGGNLRFGVPDKEKFFALTKEDVKNWLSKPLSSGYIEVSIVGDFDKDEVLSVVAKTFGALPIREASKDKKFHEDSAKFPVGGIKEIFELSSEFEKAYAIVYWPTVDYWDIETSRKLTVLSRIFSDRLRNEIRLKLGEAYSPYAVNEGYEAEKDYGRFYAVAGVKSSQANQVVDIILQIGKDLSSQGATEDEFERAIKPLIRQVELADRNNTYWLGVLSKSQVYPELIDWAQRRKAMYESFTLETINKVAKEYLRPDKAVGVVIVANKEKKQVEKEEKLERAE